MTTGIPFLDDIVAAVATEAQAIARAAGFGDRGTAGPDIHPPELDTEVMILHDRFVDGWWVDARRVDCHPARHGGPIKPWSTGLHSTDMLEDEWDALIKSWSERPGDGACANFAIGRTPAQGIVQFVPITLNSNHLGGPGHGVFVLADGSQVHPNIAANGIELHCAGGVRQIAGEWRLVENGAAHGKPIPAVEVIPDPQRPGRGWHKFTDYQFEVADRLLRDLDAAQYPLPAGVTTLAFGETVPAIAHGLSPRVVTHWEMDPVHRSDPWPPGCAWLRQRRP